MEQQEPVRDQKPTQPPSPRQLSRRTQISALFFIAALVVAGFVLGPATLRSLLGTPGPTPETTEPAGDGRTFKPTDRQWASLKVQRVENHVFQPASTTDGKIATDDDLVTPVFSPLSGRVTRLIAKPGDHVTRGDPLFTIDASELAQGQNDLISASATLRSGKAQLALAQTNEKRQHELYLAQGAALKDWQQSQLDLANAQGGIMTDQIALTAARNRLHILGKSDSDIDAIQNASDLLRLSADSVVRAPISGTVTQRQVGLGQYIVSASSGATTPVFQIGDQSKVWLVANAREEDAPRLHIGDPVEVTVLAYPRRRFDAHLTFIASSIDPSTHRLLVRAEVSNPNGELKPEMLAGFRIITGEDAMAPAVPQGAVVFEGSTAHVWVADPVAKTLEIRPVKVGQAIADGTLEVLQGLHAGESVVTAGAVFIDRAASGDKGEDPISPRRHSHELISLNVRLLKISMRDKNIFRMGDVFAR